MAGAEHETGTAAALHTAPLVALPAPRLLLIGALTALAFLVEST